ncbi:unnamed protein product [Diamesa serratosioi]
MGNIIASMQKKLTHIDNLEPTPQIKELTSLQVDLIKKTWEIPNAKPFDSGEKILFIYFERYPHNQEKFSAFKNTPLLSLKGTPGFRTHASRIMNVFSSVIDALDKDPELKGIKRIVAEVGRSHARRRISKKAFNELREVLVEVLSDVCQLDADGAVAWITLLDILYHIIFECLDGRSDQFD